MQVNWHDVLKVSSKTTTCDGIYKRTTKQLPASIAMLLSQPALISSRMSERTMPMNKRLRHSRRLKNQQRSPMGWSPCAKSAIELIDESEPSERISISIWWQRPSMRWTSRLNCTSSIRWRSVWTLPRIKTYISIWNARFTRMSARTFIRSWRLMVTRCSWATRNRKTTAKLGSPPKTPRTSTPARAARKHSNGAEIHRRT